VGSGHRFVAEGLLFWPANGHDPFMHVRGCFVLTVFLTACTSDRAPPARVSPVAPLAPLERRAPDEHVVDLRADGETLVGRTLPVPENSDADRSLALRWLTRDGVRSWRFDQVPILEARFVGSTGAVLVLTTTHSLVRLDAPKAEPVVLDREVYGPLSLDAAGRWVVYTRGEAPELEVVRTEVATGVSRALAPSLKPSWCPTLSPDGHEILVVASPEGTPAFYRLREGTPPHRWHLPADTPLPTGPTAPVIFGDAVVYESDGALYTLGFDGTLRGARRGTGLPVYVPGAPTLLTQDAQHHLFLATPRDLEGVR